MTDEPELERRWLGRAAAAAYLDCAESTVDRLVLAGHLTRYKVGGMSRYDARQIDTLVLSGAANAGATRDR
jgi:hypothetical protein